MSRVQVTELEEPLQHIHRVLQALGTGERTVEPHTTAARRAGELDAWIVLTHADLQVGKRLVVLQADVEARLNVLDEPGFQQQGIDFAFGSKVVDVGNERHEVGGAVVFQRGLGEVVGGPVAQVLRLADVEDDAGWRPS